MLVSLDCMVLNIPLFPWRVLQVLHDRIRYKVARTKKHLVSCSKAPSCVKVKTATLVSGGSEAASKPSTSSMVLRFTISKSRSFCTTFAYHFRSYGKKFQYIQPAKRKKLTQERSGNIRNGNQLNAQFLYYSIIFYSSYSLQHVSASCPLQGGYITFIA
jgi:hypothetical protein